MDLLWTTAQEFFKDSLCDQRTDIFKNTTDMFYNIQQCSYYSYHTITFPLLPRTGWMEPKPFPHSGVNT